MIPYTLPRTLLLGLLIASCAGCESTEQWLEATKDVYGCLEIDGYFTDTQGRVLKIPENQTIDEALVEALCP